MAIPFKPSFNRYAQTTFGLVAIGPVGSIEVNGMALVTGFLFGQNFFYCEDPITTTWVSSGAIPVTTWSGVSLPTTTWLDLNGVPI